MNDQNENIVSLQHAEPKQDTGSAVRYAIEGERFDLWFPKQKHSYTASTGTVHVSQTLLDHQRAYQQEQHDDYVSGRDDAAQKATEEVSGLTTPKDVNDYLQACLQEIRNETGMEIQGVEANWPSPLPTLDISFRQKEQQ